MIKCDCSVNPIGRVKAVFKFRSGVVAVVCIHDNQIESLQGDFDDVWTKLAKHIGRDTSVMWANTEVAIGGYK